MRPVPALLLLSLSAAPLAAQRPTPAEAFDRNLRAARFGTWLVLDEDGTGWAAPLQAALAQEPLATLNLPVRTVNGGKKPEPLAQVLRERYGWRSGAHWALVDAKGWIQAEGAVVPTLASLTAAAERAGVRGRVQELEDFLRTEPDHLEALCALLRERIQIAGRKTARALPVKEAAQEPPALLSDAQDQAVWGAAAEVLERLFQTAWTEVSLELAQALRDSEAGHSPLMVGLLNRRRAELEAALRRHPAGAGPWLLWLQGSQTCGGWPIVPLVQSLTPLPGSAPGEWPPLWALRGAVQDARGRGDWRTIRDLLEPRWQALEPRWEDLRGGETRFVSEGLESALLLPLVEALLNLGDPGAADQLVTGVAATWRLTGLPGRARDVAQRLGFTSLAAQWAALGTKGR